MLLTPLVLGTDKLTAMLIRLETTNNWISRYFFNPHIGGGMPLSMFVGLLTGCVLLVALAFGIGPKAQTSEAGFLLAMAAFLSLTILAATVIQLYRGVAWAAKRYGIERTLAILGAVLFMVARIITITSAAWRLIA